MQSFMTNAEAKKNKPYHTNDHPCHLARDLRCDVVDEEHAAPPAVLEVVSIQRSLGGQNGSVVADLIFSKHYVQHTTNA